MHLHRLLNRGDEPGQGVNLYEAYPEIILELDKLLQSYRDRGYSVRH